jgi:hypothetical protein
MGCGGMAAATSQKREEKMTLEFTVTFDGMTHVHELKVLSELMKALHEATTPLVESGIGAVQAVGEVRFREDEEPAVRHAFRYHGLKIPETSYPIPDTDNAFYYVDYECGDIVASVWAHVPGQFSHVPFRANRKRAYGVIPGAERQHSDNVAECWDGTFEVCCSNAEPYFRIDGKTFSMRCLLDDGQFELYREYDEGFRTKVKDMRGETYTAGEPGTWSGKGVRFELRIEDVSNYLSVQKPDLDEIPF